MYWDVGSLLLNVRKLWGEASIFERYSGEAQIFTQFRNIPVVCICVYMLVDPYYSDFSEMLMMRGNIYLI